MPTIRNNTVYSRYGGWIPIDPIIHEHFHQGLQDAVQKRHAVFGPDLEHVDAVKQFETAINGDSVMRSLFDKIFLEVSLQEHNFTTVSFHLMLHRLPVPMVFSG